MMELLAPAGSYSALCAAVQSGADAVYIGGSEFSARKGAVNFTTEEIEKAARYCHLRGVNLHVAANILIKEKETKRFLEYIGKLNDIGVDAVIIQDIGMASKIRKLYPDLPLHASTQMTVASVEAAKKLADMGFSRIVLARELTRDIIAKICKEVNIEIEVFAHGAICMCYSGQCLMSSIIGGRSGNRGMCAQPCRLPYFMDDKDGYLLSPKDMCMINHLSELSKIGVASIKIEGRLKRSEYVAAVTGIYRKYLDEPKSVAGEDMQKLYDAFSRSGFTSGYFDGELGKNMMCYENPANSAENIFSDDVKERCKENANFKKSGIFISCELKSRAPICVSVWDNVGNFARCEGTLLPEKAINRPIDKQRLESQLLKLGDNPFFAEGVEILVEDGLSLPISEINSTRRNAIEEYIKQKLRKIPRKVIKNQEEDKGKNIFPSPILVAEVSSYEQAKACANAKISQIYAPTELANRLYDELENVEIIAKLPPICRPDKEAIKPKTDSILISNIGQIDTSKKCYGDFRLNITNNESVKFYKNLERVTISPELNLGEMSGIANGQEVIAYGRLPLMVMENCPQKALGKCRNGKMIHSLKDRKGEEFLLRCSEGCFCEILNSNPIYIADKCEFIKKLQINATKKTYR